MIARLWWKETRQFWPIWLTVAGAAALGQWMMLRYFGADVRQGWLAPAALCWATLYAVAVGAAAFAGERETKTLGLLDTLGVGRGVLWGGKAGFALVSTVGLAAVLLLIANASTVKYEPKYGIPLVVAGCGLILIQAIACGLFWSSFTTSALAAAALTVVSLAFLVVGPTMGPAWDFDAVWTADLVLPRLAVIAGLSAASWAIVVAPRRSRGVPGRSRWLQFRSPVVVAPAVARDVPEGTPVSGWESWSTAVGRVAWGTVREGRKLWGLFALLVLVIPFAFALLFRDWNQFGSLVVAFNLAVAVTAGVSVFGVESRGGTNRFLASHGVRPGVVWFTKLAVWTLVLAMIWSLYLVFIVAWLREDRNPEVLIIYAIALNALGVGQLCGMVLKRGITAWLITAVVTAFLVAPLGALGAIGIMDDAWMLAPPVALLFVSWGWSGDWLLERPGLARWVRLALLLAGALGVTFGAYAAARVYGVADHRLILERQYLALDDPKLSDAENAATTYREAMSRFVELPREMAEPNPYGALDPVLLDGWDPKATRVVEWRKKNLAVIEILKRKNIPEACQFVSPDSFTLFSGYDLVTSPRFLGLLLAADAREARSRGDLDAAWDDLVAMITMARRVGRKAPMTMALQALSIESIALEQAMAWATDPKQTPERLKKAIADYEALAAAAPADETLRVEARIFERTLAQPVDQLREQLLNYQRNPGAAREVFWQKLWRDAQTTPWELARARRVAASIFAAAVSMARQEPSDRKASGPSTWAVILPDLLVNGDGSRHDILAATLEKEFRTTPLVRELVPSWESYLQATDRVETGRRAMPQVLAIKAWQLTHKGEVSPDLKTMLAASMNTVPNDPFTKKPFRWRYAEGQLVLPLSVSLHYPVSANHPAEPAVPGTWLLYSVGLDRTDHGGVVNYLAGNVSGGDLVFPISAPAPPVPKEGQPKPGEPDQLMPLPPASNPAGPGQAPPLPRAESP